MKKKAILIIVCIFVILLTSFTSYNYFSNKTKPKEEPIKSSTEISIKEPIKAEEIKPKESAVIISFAGDCTLGTDDKFAYAYSLPAMLKKQNNDYSYFFKNVSDYFKKDDLTIVNLETTFTTSNQKIQKTFNFKGDPSLCKSLSSGFIEGVNVANNHIYDYGETGFKDTLNTLKANDIGYFIGGTYWIKEINGVKFGFIGNTGFTDDKNFLSQLAKTIALLKNEGCIVISSFHWGDEGTYHPNNVQTKLSHFAIDSGADLVIGHHPHVIQGIEEYKGKYICYSLGNFCFGGNFNPPDKDSFIFQSKFEFRDLKLYNNEVKVIPCSVSSVENFNDYCPTPLIGERKDKFLTKLNNLNMDLNFKISDEFKGGV